MGQGESYGDGRDAAGGRIARGTLEKTQGVNKKREWNNKGRSGIELVDKFRRESDDALG